MIKPKLAHYLYYPLSEGFSSKKGLTINQANTVKFLQVRNSVL